MDSNYLALGALAAAAIIGASGHDGWGWCLLVALLLAHVEYLRALAPPHPSGQEGWRLVPLEPTEAQHIAAMEFALAHMKAHGVTSLSPFKDFPPLRETTAGMYRAMLAAVP